MSKIWFRGIDKTDCYGLFVKEKMVKPTWIEEWQAEAIKAIVRDGALVTSKRDVEAIHEK